MDDSEWGYTTTDLLDAETPGEFDSDWGFAVGVVRNPHQPIGVWDGVEIRSTPLFIWDGDTLRE